MNIKFFIFIFFNISFAKELFVKTFTQDSEQAFINAVESAIKSAFPKHCETVDILQTKDSMSSDISSQALKNSFAVPVRVEILNFSRQKHFNRFCVLIILKSAENFKNNEASFSLKSFNTQGYFMLVLLNGTVKDATDIFTTFWKKKIYNVFVILEISKITNALTFMPFSPGKCDKVSVVNLNQFDVVQNSWKRQFDFPKKFENLHACQIIHATTVAAVVESSRGNFRGTEIDILETLGREMNFTIEHKVMKILGRIDANGTGTGVMKDLYDGKFDIASGSLQLDRTKVFGVSYPFLSDSLILIIPPGNLFSPFEKLYKAFSWKVWIGIVAVFVIAIFSLNLVSKNFKRFLNIQSPHSSFFNIFNVFFGGSLPLKQVPTQHCTRYSMAVFMIYAMIIRTAYVAILFINMRSDVRHREVESLDEMIEKDFTFYIYEISFFKTTGFQFLERSVILHIQLMFSKI